MFTSAEFRELLAEGLNDIFDGQYNVAEGFVDQIFNVKSSSKAWEEDFGYGTFGQAPMKGEVAQVQYQDPKAGNKVIYVHDLYALGYIVSKVMIEDDQYSQISKLPAALATSMRVTREQLGANVFEDGFDTTWVDGVYLFSATHPRLDGGTNDNLISVDLDATGFAAAKLKARRLKNETGSPIIINGMTLIVPPELEDVAERLLNSTLAPSWDIATPGAGAAANNAYSANDINVIKKWLKKYICWPYLSDTNNWYLKLDTGMPGFKFYDRRKPTQDSQSDFDRSAMKFKSEARFSAGCSDYREAIGAGVT
jgi:phage major head subunit gpT-like protein